MDRVKTTLWEREFWGKNTPPLFVKTCTDIHICGPPPPQALSRQGCHHTALECCKLLLALEPEDPMGALQVCMCAHAPMHP